MSKVRFDGLDVQAMVAYLQGTFAGRRVVNIYDGLTGESYIFKLEGENDKSKNSNSKEFLLLESGIRFHTISNFQADALPTPFCAKLRKHIRGLRLELITQIGSDRVVLFQFGAGPSKHSIILELYAKGNLILTDKDYTVLALLRSHVYNEPTTMKQDSSINTVAVQVGQVYPVAYATSLAALEGTTTSEVVASAKTVLAMSSAEEFCQWALAHIQTVAASAATKKKRKQLAGVTLKTLLLQNHDSGVSQYGPALIEHCIRTAELDPNTNLVELVKNQEDLVQIWNEDEWKRLRDSLHHDGPRILQYLESQNSSNAGYILYRPRDTASDNDEAANPDALTHADKILLEFQPILLKQHKQSLHIRYDNFSEAVEDYFDHLQNQKSIQKAVSAEKAAAARLEKVRADQQERIRALEAQQDSLEHEAKTVQLNADSVDKALAVINSALDSGMDWDQLEQVVQVEQQQNRNPIALLIHKLELEQDTMILRLPSMTKDSIVDEENVPTLDVRVSLKESAYANANTMFAKYRASKEKSLKTIEASEKALKAVEETVKRQRAEAQKRSKQNAAAVPGGKRKPAWFEKFHWFITTENFLVLGGRDAHQNELLVKRYLRPGDAYLHADVHGAASCILRAKRRRRNNGNGTDVLPLSAQALRETGNFTICRSSAWTSRMVTSSWWVESHQVSKTAPTGEYLSVGSFMIRGKKNFLPPTPLEMGLAVLFRLGDDDSILRHKNERRDFALLEDQEEIDDFALKNDDVSGEDARATYPKSKTDNDCMEEVNAFGDEGRATDHHLKVTVPVKQTSVALNDPVTAELIAEHRLSEGSDEERINGSGGSAGKSNKATDRCPESGATQLQRTKRGYSARDRRLIKKYGSLEEAKIVQGSSVVPEEGDHKPVNEVSITSATLTVPTAPKRGKKAKLKRVVRKYGDQDDEDRELAMLALQGGEKLKNEQPAKLGKGKVDISESQQKVAAETVALLVKDSFAVAAQLPEEVRSILAECVTIYSANDDKIPTIRWDKFDADTLEQLLALAPMQAQVAAATRLSNLKKTTRIDNFSASLGGTCKNFGWVLHAVLVLLRGNSSTHCSCSTSLSPPGVIRTIRKHGYEMLNEEKRTDDAPSRKKTRAENDKESTIEKHAVDISGDSDLDEGAVDDTSELLKLTGKPHPDDSLLFAVPVCAPYHTLSQYAYRIKLTPGNMKRGKSSKQCVDLFLKASSSKTTAGVDRQLDLIKKVGENDWVQVICADVKISAAGSSKTTKLLKGNIKKSKKGK